MHYDQVGSLVALTATDGGILKRVTYDSFGNILSDTNPAFSVLGFAGGLYDSDTGLIRFGYRDYDPETERWTSKDPIGFDGGDTDLYGYCGWDPVNWVDEFGFSKWYPVPGQNGWEARRDPPHHSKDYYHDHYRYKGKTIPRKVNLDWGRVFLDTELGLRIDPQEVVHDQIRNSRSHAQTILGAA